MAAWLRFAIGYAWHGSKHASIYQHGNRMYAMLETESEWCYQHRFDSVLIPAHAVNMLANASI